MRSSAPRELDELYGSNPDLAAMPMYCAAFSFKDVFDASDMRSTGGADVRYGMDAAPAGLDDRGRAARQRRDHLREGELVRVQRRRRQSRRSRDDDPHVRRRRSQHVGRHGVQCLRPIVRDRRLELGLGGVGRRQSRHVLDLRGDGRLVPAACLAQRRRRSRHDQRAAAVRRLDRRGALSRPRRHSPAGRCATRRSCSTRSGIPSAATSIRATSTARYRARCCRNSRTRRSRSATPRSR